MESVIAPHFAHLNSNAKTLNPSSNSLTLESGETVKYDYLVVAPGLKSSESTDESVAYLPPHLTDPPSRVRCRQGSD